MVGKTISHYKILEKLGEGGMGVVYKAEDTKLDRLVALKFLPRQFTINEEEKKRFIHEAKAAAALDHPNICSIFEINETDDGQMFMVMAYYPGQTLREKISTGPLPIDEAIEIAIQIAQGLNIAHKKDIVHRDIKPANIFITGDGLVKILDFGLAKLKGVTKLTKEGTTMGTVAYMSPEQTIGEVLDHRSDIWSLGVILYEMLTNELPFKGHYEQAVIYSIMNEDPEFPSQLNKDIPVSLEKIVLKALHKNLQRRFQNMNELCQALQNIRKESTTVTGRKTLPIIRMSRRQKMILMRSLPIIMVFITISIYILFFRNTGSVSKTIAILPLTTIGNQSGTDWFSDGMTDTLITQLAKIRNLRVTSRNSVMKYRDSKKSFVDIAKELNVSYIMEGSVLKIGNQIKITTRLLDPSQDKYLWAQDYERDLSNIISLQGEVARTIADQIKVNLSPGEETILNESHKVNPQAYEAYLKGLFYYYKLTKESLVTAMKYFKMAVEFDPEYAPAYVGMAMVWGGRAQMGFVPFHLAREKMEPAAAKAQQLDSTLVEVHYLKALMYSWWGWQWDVALKKYRQVIDMNPNWGEARANYSQVLFINDRPVEGMNQIKEALALDPFNSVIRAFFAMDLMYIRDYDQVIESMEKLFKESPEEYMALTTLRSAYHQKKMYTDALRIWRLSFQARNDHEAIEILDKGNQEGGYSRALQRVAELMIERRQKGTHITPWQIATLYTRAGIKEEALSWLQKALEARDPNMPYLKVDPIFDELREDPRYIAMLKKIGLHP